MYSLFSNFCTMLLKISLMNTFESSFTGADVDYICYEIFSNTLLMILLQNITMVKPGLHIVATIA